MGTEKKKRDNPLRMDVNLTPETIRIIKGLESYLNGITAPSTDFEFMQDKVKRDNLLRFSTASTVNKSRIVRYAILKLCKDAEDETLIDVANAIIDDAREFCRS